MRKDTTKHGETAFFCDGCDSLSPYRYGHEPPREWSYAGFPGALFCLKRECQQWAAAANLQEAARALAELAPKMDFLPREGAEWVRNSARVRELAGRILAVGPVQPYGEHVQEPEDPDE